MTNTRIDLPPSPLLAESEAAAYLTLQPSTLRAWRYRGGGPRFVTLGRAVRYRLIDLDAWLERRVVSNTSEAAALEAAEANPRDLVDTIPRPPRMSKARPKKAPPPSPVPPPPDVQAAPGEPSPAMVADMVRDAAIVALVSGHHFRRAGARRAVIAAMKAGARTIEDIVARATGGELAADEVDAGEAVDVQAAEGEAGPSEVMEGEAGPSEVDLEAIGDEVVRLLVADGMSEADADTYVAFAFDDLDPSEITAEALLERARYHAVMMRD